VARIVETVGGGRGGAKLGGHGDGAVIAYADVEEKYNDCIESMT
jgi:hypothetical protein